MEREDMLAAVRNDGVEFATTRPPGSAFASLERRVVITGPVGLVELAGVTDPGVLDELAKLLQDPARAWAAAVLLAAMTRREEKIIDSFAATPDEWWEALGKTAYERWMRWLDETRGKLVWDAENRVFIEAK